MCATVVAQVPSALQGPLEDARRLSYQYWGYTIPPQASFQFILDPQLQGNAGATKFLFTDGRVIVQEMRIAARANMPDVLPHEVDHLVRATIVCKPIPRWIDEGCSSQFEAGNDWPGIVQSAQAARQWVDESTLELMEYPDNRTHELYGFGHTAVQCLLRRNSPKTLIALQVDQRTYAQKLPDYYGLTATEFVQVWRNESVLPQYCDSRTRYVPYPQTLPVVNNKPLLEIWSAEWCEPCHKFKADYNSDAGFRELLSANYHIHFRDFENPCLTLEKTLKGIDRVPSFLVHSQQRRVVGYSTKEKLLSGLGIRVGPAPYIRTPSTPVIPITPTLTIPIPNVLSSGITLGEEAPIPGLVPPGTPDPPVKPLEGPLSPSNFQGDPEYVPTPSDASTGQPEPSMGLLRWGFGKIWDNKALLLGGALLATGFGGGLGGYLIKGWATKKVGTIVAHIGDRHEQPQQRPPTCATVIPSPPIPPVVVPTPDVPPIPPVIEQRIATQYVEIPNDQWRKAILYGLRQTAQRYPASVDTLRFVEIQVNHYMGSTGQQLVQHLDEQWSG